LKYKLIAIRDRVADIFGTPNAVANLGQAVRSFSDEINRDDPSNMLAKHPDDFDLYHLGEYDDAHGTFEILDKPRQLALGRDMANKASPKLRTVS